MAAGYGTLQVVRDVSFDVSAGEVLCLTGRNGAGKTTSLKTVMGLVRATEGAIELEGGTLLGLPAHEIPRLGIGYVPQGRRLFSDLSVDENLEIGLMAGRQGPAMRDRVLGLFPRLGDRLAQRAGTLSGGEQQMLAVGRALCLDPRVILLDEPTEGLQPSMVSLIQSVILELRAEGVAIVLVEQRLDAVNALADKVTFIENGVSRETLLKSELQHNQSVLRRYAGLEV